MMNKSIEHFTRESLKEGLKKLPEKWQLTFRRMYSHEDLEKDISIVVDEMPIERLDWALTQVENSLNKLEIDI